MKPKCGYRNCQKVLVKKKYTRKFCDATCMGKEQTADKIAKWLSGEWDGSVEYGLSQSVRKYLLKQAGYKCSKCGWSEPNKITGKPPVEINHIDGNYKNNRPENLEVLCPNCHAITGNYKALNKEGRSWRKNYKQFELKIPLERKEQIKEEARKKKSCSCGNTKDRGSKVCEECWIQTGRHKTTIDYPPIPELIEMVEEKGFLQTGKALGVSDNTVRKHLIRHGVDPLPRRLAKKEK